MVCSLIGSLASFCFVLFCFCFLFCFFGGGGGKGFPNGSPVQYTIVDSLSCRHKKFSGFNIVTGMAQNWNVWSQSFHYIPILTLSY